MTDKAKLKSGKRESPSEDSKHPSSCSSAHNLGSSSSANRRVLDKPSSQEGLAVSKDLEAIKEKYIWLMTKTSDKFMNELIKNDLDKLFSEVAQLIKPLSKGVYPKDDLKIMVNAFESIEEEILETKVIWNSDFEFARVDTSKMKFPPEMIADWKGDLTPQWDGFKHAWRILQSQLAAKDKEIERLRMIDTEVFETIGNAVKGVREILDEPLYDKIAARQKEINELKQALDDAGAEGCYLPSDKSVSRKRVKGG